MLRLNNKRRISKRPLFGGSFGNHVTRGGILPTRKPVRHARAIVEPTTAPPFARRKSKRKVKNAAAFTLPPVKRTTVLPVKTKTIPVVKKQAQKLIETKPVTQFTTMLGSDKMKSIKSKVIKYGMYVLPVIALFILWKKFGKNKSKLA